MGGLGVSWKGNSSPNRTPVRVWMKKMLHGSYVWDRHQCRQHFLQLMCALHISKPTRICSHRLQIGRENCSFCIRKAVVSVIRTLYRRDCMVCSFVFAKVLFWVNCWICKYAKIPGWCYFRRLWSGASIYLANESLQQHFEPVEGRQYVCIIRCAVTHNRTS